MKQVPPVSDSKQSNNKNKTTRQKIDSKKIDGNGNEPDLFFGPITASQNEKRVKVRRANFQRLRNEGAYEELPDDPREQLRYLVQVVKAVRQGDFSVRYPIGGDGLVCEIGEIVNDIVEMNHNMAEEFVRVSKMVGQEGKMHERASIGMVKGAWATNIFAFNSVIGDLVQPTNEVARVITSVAKGDLSQKMSLEIDGRPVKGEFNRIGTTVNAMVDQLNSFASEVTRVAKEVGTEGKLGGQAEVRGASGIWRDLTDNVNQLAGNLTSQVRNIAKVTTAVAKGDLSQKITVDAKGEVYELKNTINTMVDQLN
ncbi:MAG: HAMP domain-containing protein, partial [Bdellovibrionia bacterium]